jgi:hypothetical protein
LFSSFSLPNHDLTISLSCKIDVSSGSLLRLLLEGVQHIDPLRELRHHEHAVRNARVNPYFNRSGTNDGHRFPVIRISSFLKLAKLESSLSARLVGKGPDIVEGGATPSDGFVQWQ